MKQKKYYLLVIGILITGILAISSVSASSTIDSLFNQMIEVLNKKQAVSDSEIIAKVGDKEITVGEFRQYRENLRFMERYRGNELNRNNSEILTDMIKRELIIQYAKDLGITVSDEELAKTIQETRKAIEVAGTQEVKDILRNLIKKSGLNEEEYWKSKETLDLYRDWILIGKLGAHLHQKGIIAIDQPQEFEEFENSLLDKLEHKISIHENIIQRIE